MYIIAGARAGTERRLCPCSGTSNFTSQHDFAVKYKIGYFNGNRCPGPENDVSFFISRLVVAQFFLSIYSLKM